MAQVIDLKASGLHTHPNALSLPQGALTRALNITIDRENVIDTVRGTARYGAVLANYVDQIMFYKERTLLHHGTVLSYDSDGAGTWVNYTGAYSAPTGRKMRSFRANSNLYFTTSEGIKKLDGLTSSVVAAGCPKGLDGSAALAVAGAGFLALDAAVAYRVVWGITDANDNLILGAPSQRILVANPAAGISADNVNVTFTIPAGITTSHIYQIYRSGPSASATDEANDELQLVIERSPTAGEIAAGTITVLDNVVDDLRGATLYTSPSQEGIAAANDLPPLAKDVTVFKDHALYANTQTRQRYNLTMVACGGANFFYFATTATTVNGNPDMTVASATNLREGQVVECANFPAGTKVISVVGTTVTCDQNATAGGAGVAVTFHDCIVIDGVTYIGDNATTVANREFQVFSTGNPAEDIEDTMKELIQVVNQYAGSNVYGYYLSGFEDLPGQALFEDRVLGGAAWAVTSSYGNSFSPILPVSGTTEQSNNETKKNRIHIAKPKQPEACPLLQYIDVGSADDDIMRVIALRDSVFVLKKTEGIWRITGEAVTSFVASQFDKSASIRGPETAVELNNAVWCYSTQGVISCSDNGVQVWSRAIENDLLKISAAEFTNFDSVTFGIAYETDRKYYLWLPTETGDTYATQARIYNTFTGAWTENDDLRRCGGVNPADDKLYLADAAAKYVRKERKTYTRFDKANDQYAVTIVGYVGTTVEVVSSTSAVANQTLYQSGKEAIVVSVPDGTHIIVDEVQTWTAAAATLYDPIDVEVTWGPLHGGNPGLLKQFPEATFFFKDAEFDTLSLSFASNFSETSADISLEPISTGTWGSGLWGMTPWGGGPPADQPIRTYIPLEQQRAHWLNMAMTLEQALTNIGMEGISLVMNEMDTRF